MMFAAWDRSAAAIVCCGTFDRPSVRTIAMRGIPLDLGLAPKVVLNSWTLRFMPAAVSVCPPVYGMLATASRREDFVRCVLRWNCTEADVLNRTTPTRVLSGPMSEWIITLETKFRIN